MKGIKKSIKKALIDHRGTTATVAGLILGVGATIFYYEKDTLLLITDEDFNSIEGGRTGVYETNHGRVFVRNS